MIDYKQICNDNLFCGIYQSIIRLIVPALASAQSDLDLRCQHDTKVNFCLVGSYARVEHVKILCTSKGLSSHTAAHLVNPCLAE